MAQNIFRRSVLALALLAMLAANAFATVSTQANKVIALGNGALAVFNYNFNIPAAADAVVIFTDASGNETTLNPTQYSIAGIGNPMGGTVTYPLTGAPIAAGTTLTILRVVPYTQTTSFPNQGGFFPSVVESSLDFLTMQAQQLAEAQARVISFPPVDPAGVNATLPPAAARASLYLGFDIFGNVAVLPGTTGASVVGGDLSGMTNNAKVTGLQGNPVAATAPTSGFALVWSGSQWAPASIAAGGTVTNITCGTGLSGGAITISGSCALAPIGNNSLLANVSGGTAAPIAKGLGAVIDSAISNVQGTILYRASTGWTGLAPGVSGLFLQTQGASQNPQWATGAGISAINIQAFTATGTYTPTSGMKYCIVYAWGAGGGSGGGTNGGAGGQTSLGTLVSAAGGSGGASLGTGGAGGTGGTGPFLIDGQAGGTAASFIDGTGLTIFTGGYGGGSPGMSPLALQNVGVATGIAGTMPGQGAAGIATAGPSGTGGGGGGEQAMGTFSAATIGASKAVTIGAGGTAGSGGAAGFRGYLYVVEFK